MTAQLGCVHPRVAMNITYNRPANTSGRQGHSVALDLKCEHSNKDFQGNIDMLLPLKFTIMSVVFTFCQCSCEKEHCGLDTVTILISMLSA